MIEFFVWFIVTECIIEFKGLIVDVLGNAIHFIFCLVTDDSWIWTRYHINFSLFQLLLEDWPFFNTYIDFQGVSSPMLLHKWYVFLLGFNQLLEVYINFPTLCLIFCLTPFSMIFNVFHPFPSLLTIIFNFFDLVCARWLLLHLRGIGSLMADFVWAAVVRQSASSVTSRYIQFIGSVKP